MEQNEKPESLTEWEALSREANQDRRKGKRVTLAFPIEISGFDRRGRLFRDSTTTCDISELGCRFRVKTQLERGDVVAIKLIRRTNGQAPERKPLLFQIAWVAREADGWVAGALMLQPDNFWNMTFPATGQPKTPST